MRAAAASELQTSRRLRPRHEPRTGIANDPEPAYNYHHADQQACWSAIAPHRVMVVRHAKPGLPGIHVA